MTAVTPRCGQVMLRFETRHGALLDDVLCGRPAGHNGPHRSTLAIAKAVEYERKRWPANAERRRQARRRAVLAEALRGFDRYRWKRPARKTAA